MIESGRGAGFALEAFQGARIADRVVRQKLQSNHAAKANVLGSIDDAHAARTQFLVNAIVRDDLRNNVVVHGRATPALR